MWLNKKDATGDLNEELHFHLEQEIAQNIAQGMSPEEARRQALIAFGGVQQTHENVREVRWSRFIEIFLQDLAYGWRLLRRSPGFTAVAVLTLALGIGMNSAIFSLIDAVLFRALPTQHPEELMLLKWHAARAARNVSTASFGDCQLNRATEDPMGCSFSVPFFRQSRSLGVFSDAAAFSAAPELDLSGNGAASIIHDGQLVSGEFFGLLGTKAATGRLLQPSDDSPDAPPVMVLSHSYWQSAFGGARDTVGRTVRLNGKTFAIVGVAEPGFTALSPGKRASLWLPLSAARLVDPHWTADDDSAKSWWLVVVARLKSGVTAAQAQSALTLLYQNQTEHGEMAYFTDADAPNVGVVPAQLGLTGGGGQLLQILYVLMMAVGLVLLIACANIAGLLLARSAARSKEIAVRLTLGARRGRLISQLLVESLLLSSMGGALALAFAHWGALGLWRLTSENNSGPLPFTPHLDWHVLAFTAAIALIAGVLFGLAPALHSLRVDLTPTLKAGGSGSDVGATRRKWYGAGNALVVTQVALAIVAMVSAGLLVRTLRNLQRADLGFAIDHLLVFGLDPALAGYKGAQVGELNRELQQQIAALPGVSSVTFSWTSLMRGWQTNTGVHIPGTPEDEAKMVQFLPVGPKFFATMKIPLKLGRDFDANDFAAAGVQAARPNNVKTDPHGPPVAVVVNEAFVRRFFPRVNPLGQHVEATIDDPSELRGPGWEIIGIAGDARYDRLRGEMEPTMYEASAGNACFSVRTSADPLAMVPAIRNLINQRNSDLAMFEIATQEQQIGDRVSAERLVARLSTFFGLLALVLASAGIYGLLSYEVARRTREIGIRMAIGAQRGNVVGMVLRQGLLVAGAGTAIGVATSFAVNGLMKKILYQVRPGDPVTLLAVTAILLTIALLACFVPARRATRVDPLVALRYE